MCFCLIYFNIGDVGSCVDMYLGIFVNRIEVEVLTETHVLKPVFVILAPGHI